MSVLFNHARRHEFTDHNPINLVRQSAKRPTIPEVLLPSEINRLDAAGRVIGASNVARDITERRQAERAMAEQARLLDLSNDAIFVRDAGDQVIYWNKAATELYGFTREEALGRVTHELLQTQFPKNLEKINEHLHRDGRWNGELVHTRKDGAKVIVISRWVLDREGNGNALRILETNSDITQQKRTEKALRESEERFRAIVETTPECVKLVSADGTLLHMNRPGLEMVGARSADEVVGKNVYDLIAAEDRDRFKAFNESICRGEQGSLQFDIVGLEGKRRHMAVTARCTTVSSGFRKGAAWVSTWKAEEKNSEIHLLGIPRANQRLLIGSTSLSCPAQPAVHIGTGGMRSLCGNQGAARRHSNP